ncbi:MAG: hypothetical protein CM15mP18_1180 [Methanobacteriota archaeon]|nr:MAG: hypothetical protein CM15mP18_1180 [Euryarchaeota archaeon]
MKRRATIDLDKMPEAALYDFLIGIYVCGCDSIVVKSKAGLKTKQRRTIRNFLRDTRGMEVSVDEEKQMEIISLLNPNELPLQVSLNRMYLLVISIVQDALDVLDGEDNRSSAIRRRERQIDARRLSSTVAMALQSPSIERPWAWTGFKPWSTPQWRGRLSEWEPTPFLPTSSSSAALLNEGFIAAPGRTGWDGFAPTIIRNTY